MTSPNEAVPGGAYTKGGSNPVGGVQGWNQTRVWSAMSQGLLGSWERAQDTVHEVNNRFTDRIDGLRDAQLDLIDRVDLLESVSGYCSTFMSKNWELKGGPWRRLPFDQQLGPRKGTQLLNGGILLEGKGLWRVDAHLTWYPAPSGWGQSNNPGWTSISVTDADTSQTYTERVYYGVITPYGAETASFSHTFVIPQDNRYVVHMWASHGQSWHWVYGGTVRSALSVNRWDTGTQNAVNLPTVPDGGKLE